MIFFWLTDLFGNHLKLIVRSANQNNIQASSCQLEGDMQTNKFDGFLNPQQYFALEKSPTLDLKSSQILSNCRRSKVEPNNGEK